MKDELYRKYTSLDDLKSLPQWNGRDVTLLWHSVWCDGPIRGMISYKGVSYWFDACADDEEGICTFYLVFPVTDAETAQSAAWTEARKAFNALPMEPQQQRHQAALDLDKSTPDLSNREPIAWFSSGHNRSFDAIQVFYPSPTT